MYLTLNYVCLSYLMWFEVFHIGAGHTLDIWFILKHPTITDMWARFELIAWLGAWQRSAIITALLEHTHTHTHTHSDQLYRLGLILNLITRSIYSLMFKCGPNFTCNAMGRNYTVEYILMLLLYTCTTCMFYSR